MLLFLVYVCLIVIVRFTFFPFDKVDGRIQPLVLYISEIFSPRINVIPIVHIFDYSIKKEFWLNLIGNVAMFVPVGIIWPCVFNELNTPSKAILSGVGFSLCIEIMQLPFYDRVSDVDDIIMNSTGFIIGYVIYYLINIMIKKRKKI